MSLQNSNINVNSLDSFLNTNKGCSRIESVLPKARKIIAIGDIHGDLSALRSALEKAKVIRNDRWVAGDTIIVQVGDVLDRGGRGEDIPTNGDLEEISILNYLYELNKLAKQQGGRVISLIGNHELMNVLGDFRYVSNNHIAGLGGYSNRKTLFKPGGEMARKLACNSLGIVVIGDWIFVHGGLLPSHLEYLKTSLKNRKLESNGNTRLKGFIYRINDLVKGILLGNIKMHDISPEEEKILFDSDGIFWTRKYSSKKNNDNRCGLILDTLNLMNLNLETGGIVVGHTPQNHINSVCNDKIWRIDTGMSEAFGRRLDDERIEILVIENNGQNIYTI